MRRFVFAVTVAAVGSTIFAAAHAAEAGKSKETAAVAAAEAWLKLVDEAKYADSWKESAASFKSAVKQTDWERMVGAVRSPFGKLASRKVKTATYTTSVPGAPAGEYVVIQFDASFSPKKDAVETVTPTLDKDGKWRVSGYFIK